MKNQISSIFSIVILCVSCMHTNLAAQENLTNESTDTKQENYERKEYDFYGYSTEGGRLDVYFTKNNTIAYFEIELMGEQSKVLFKFELIDSKTISILEKRYEYAQSIYESGGDIEIISQKNTKYILKNGNTLEPQDDLIPVLYKEAMRKIHDTE